MVIMSVQRRYYAVPPRPLRQARVLRGEVLCDEHGQLYEQVGPYVRRLNHLSAGPDGELLDLNPSTPAGWMPPDENQPRDPGPVPVIDAEVEPVEDSRAGVRILLPPGTRRVVRFGDVRSYVEPQLARPDRLREGHRLNCFVQVVEAVRPQPVRALVPCGAGGERGTAAVERLTPGLAAALGLSGLQQPGDVEPAHATDRAQAGERFVLIQVADDPTAAMRAARPRAPAEAIAPPEPPRTTIPAACLRPWEFVRAREEAEYDAAADAARGPLSRAWRSFRGALLERAAYRRWRALLTGRTHDEQLWVVRPPQGSLANPAVQAWAAAMLASGGYDAPAMLREWELFWRRKGL